jgi:hypothetical protein
LHRCRAKVRELLDQSVVASGHAPDALRVGVRRVGPVGVGPVCGGAGCTRRAETQRGVKIADLLIAAAAEVAGLVGLHYDDDFERIADITGRATEWIITDGTFP